MREKGNKGGVKVEQETGIVKCRKELGRCGHFASRDSNVTE